MKQFKDMINTERLQVLKDVVKYCESVDDLGSVDFAMGWLKLEFDTIPHPFTPEGGI